MTTAFIVDGNGGEFRKSFHGTAKGFAMLVSDPFEFNLQPMMINTRNPNGSAVPGGPLPKGSRAPSNAEYSGLLECPCTDRKPKVVTKHNVVESGVCASKVGTAADCFKAVAALGLTPIQTNSSVASAAAPAGCSVTATQTGFDAVFNSAPSVTPCGNATGPRRALGANSAAGVEVSVDLNQGTNCTPATSDLAGGWDFPGSKQFPGKYAVGFTQINATFYSVKISQGICGDPGCVGRLDGSTFTMVQGFPKALAATVAPDWGSMTFTNGATWDRQPACTGLATITAKGPSAAWFGAGFGGSTMKDTYTIIIDGDGVVTERQLGDHDPGIALARSVTVTKSVVADGVRTVTVTRTLAGLSPQHFSFDPTADAVPFVGAVGSGPTFAYHHARGSALMMLVEVGGPMCVCEGGASGSIDGVAFNNHCVQQPLSDLLALKNDICFIETYEGGLKCCSHKSILLDSDQTIPPAIDTFQMKFSKPIAACSCTPPPGPAPHSASSAA